MTNESLIHLVCDDAASRSHLENILRHVRLQYVVHATLESFRPDPARELPGCLLIYVAGGSEDFLRMEEQLTQMPGALPIIILCANCDIPFAVRSMKTGIRDFLEYPVCADELLDRIKAALDDDAQKLAAIREMASLQRKFDLLTARERQVMDRLVAGDTAEQIGLKLGLRAKTVYTHRTHILLKLGVDSIAGLTRLALSTSTLDDRSEMCHKGPVGIVQHSKPLSRETLRMSSPPVAAPNAAADSKGSASSVAENSKGCLS